MTLEEIRQLVILADERATYIHPDDEGTADLLRELATALEACIGWRLTEE